MPHSQLSGLLVSFGARETQGMTEEQSLYIETGRKIDGAEESQMFGKPCFKINGKAFVAFFENCMVFKLQGDLHAEAIKLGGAQLFDPSGKKRPMKEGVQVPYAHKAKWLKYAKAALEYVKGSK
jgi:hypothetical protein